MTASRIITLTNELTQYSFAAEQFSAKYGNLPGIIDNPQKILGNTAKSKIDDEKIDTNAINESASITNAESINFFNHLYLSGLLGESSAPFVGTNEDLSSKSEITKDSNYYPRLKSIKSMFIYVRGDDIDGNYNKLNRLTVSNYSSGILGINADLIFGLDNKVDDGLPLSGLISIVPMKISNYGSSDKSSSYNNNRNNNTQIASINNVIDYYLMSSKSINSFNIINTANAENGNTKSNNSSTSCLVLDKSTNEIKYNTKGKNCFILRNIDSTQQNKITDLGLSGTTGESCNLLNKDDYPNAESVAGTTMLNGSKKTIKCNDGYTGNITITCNEGHPIHSGDAQCTFTGCKRYDNNVINSSLNAILTTNDVVNWDNIDETEKNNLSTNSDISYSKNDTIATLSCKEKEGYKLKEGSNGYTIKCDGNDNIIVDNNGGCEYEVLTCSISDLTTNILGNEFVKTITQCNDESCLNINTNEIIDITTEESKTKTFNYNTYITINTCNTGYSAPENKRVMRCGENGEWDVKEETKENACIFTGCNDMSAVFDKNGNMISSQLYKTTFAYNSGRNIFPILFCKDTSSTNNAKSLSTTNEFVVNINTLITCGEDNNPATNGVNNDIDHRKFTCIEDTTNINNGNSYWKYDFVSCDLNEIKDKGYTVWLAKDLVQAVSTASTSNATTLDTNTFQKRYMANEWGTKYGIATSKYNDFRLKCNSSGNWEMSKTTNSCNAVPTLLTGSKLYENDDNILYVENQPGMLMNTSILSNDTSTLTTAILSNTSQYFVTNGTKIEASCNTGFQEVDRNNLVIGQDGCESGGHYYECVDGTWTARGGCTAKTCSVKDLTVDILGNELVKTIAWCADVNCNTFVENSIIDITLDSNKEQEYEYSAIIAIYTCDTGYSAPNKRMLRCNENGEWVIYRNTGNNKCIFTGCNDMSAVFDKNGNKVSEQLYDMTFGSNNSSNGVYPIVYCHNNDSADGSSYTELSTNNKFVVNSGNIATCGDNTGVVLTDTKSEDRHYVCTADTTNINNGSSYWKTKTASCDLNTIRSLTNSGYTAYLSKTNNSTLVTLENKTTQHRYLNTVKWSSLYTDQASNFALTCNSNGNWIMSKGTNSCNGAPVLIGGSGFYKNDTNILYVENQPGMLMNTSTLSKDISALTKTKLTNTSQYFMTNGAKIEANCVSGSIEVDKNNVAESDSSADKGGHYYECVNGTWTARGGCQVKLDYYSPKLYDDINNTGNIALTKNVKVGDTITCDFESFGISDPNSGTLKICAINGYRVAVDGESFTVSVPTNHTFCHKSYIPRDLGAGLNGSVGVDGWCDDWITNDTYKGVGANVSNGSSFVTGHNDTNVSTSTTLVCNNGTWKVGSGSITFEYTGSVKTFCAPYGLKDAGKSITFELWGASSAVGNVKGYGGYTKGVMGSGVYSNMQKFYVVVGQEGREGSLINAFNGGGKSGSREGTMKYYSGAGATHIATESGVLSSLESNKSAVLLVAGGSGGNVSSWRYSFGYNAGNGGGGNNSGGDGGNDGGKGGTQEAGGSGSGMSVTSGSFGRGADCASNTYCWGGGGGYYGGGAASDSDRGGAGGGSGYCNTSKFTCSGENGKRDGNGRVVISW